MNIKFRINGNEVKASEGMTILEAARDNEIYIPRVCYHPSLGSSHGLNPVQTIYREDGKDGEYRNDGSGPEDGFPGCRLCLVEIDGREGLFTSCDTLVTEGMEIDSESEDVKKARRDNLVELLRDHPHACLQCAQQEGCSRTQCSTNVPENERCCPLLGHCELQKVSQYVGIKEDLTKYVSKDLPKHHDEALFDRDHNLCIACLRCVRACRDLRGVETLGFVYEESKALVGPTGSSTYAGSDCRFCGACVEVCPTGALTDKDLPRGDREDVLVPCNANCPAGIDIPGYIRLISEGKYAESAALIRERLPFPGILGLVCFHPCEDACRRGELNRPMAICKLKWFAAENGAATLMETVMANTKESTGKRVAIVGSGPSGLSAAYYLALSGHGVTVFEGREKIGGMLRYAIPDYRLAPDVLERELAILDALKVEFRTCTSLGKEITLSDLRRDHQAVFLGTGACLSKRISLEGSELTGVEWGLDFLNDVKTKSVISMTGRVVVIGGGNVAMDVARSAVRMGAGEVRLACLESAGEMPAHDWEIEEAREEGVVMNPSWGPRKISGENGKVTGIELVKCTSVFDRQGRFAPVFDEGETKSIDTDRVILAIGQISDLSCIEDRDCKQEIETRKGTISVDAEMQTGSPGVFAGGEAARGPASVVEAVADGAAAASAIDRYLGGDGNIYRSLTETGGTLADTEPDPFIGKIEGFADMNRVDIPKSDPEVRKRNFEMVERCYDEQQARDEALRCLRCDLRLHILPVTLPPEKWLELNEENISTVPAGEGVYQLLDEEKNVLAIKGTGNLRDDLLEKLDSDTKARYFMFDEDKMYSKRENELLQVYMQQHGRMPEGDGGDDDLDDLF